MHLFGKSTVFRAAVAMLLLFAACKESPPPTAASEEKAEDAFPTNPSPPYEPEPQSPSTDTDTCGSSSSSTEDDTDTETDTSTDTEESEGDDPFGLTGKTTVVKKHKKKTRKAKSPKKPKKAKAKKPALKSGSGFKLVETVSYDSDIKSLLDQNCTSCHKPGGDSPDLSTYSAAKSGLSSSISQINADKMPKSSPLSASDKAKFEAWQSAGAPESSSDSDTDTDTDTDSDSDSDSSSSDDCGSSSGEDDEFGDGYHDLVNPPELEECKDKGKVYDRKAGECHKAEIAEFSCDRSGILEAFKKVGVNADAKLSDITGEGYEIDQCGIYDKEPIVYFTKQGDSSGDSVSLKIKKLCKPSASVCK